MLISQTYSTDTLIRTYPTQTLKSEMPHVELSFGVTGKSLPIDHGYGLYAALSHWQTQLHKLKGIGIQNITGIIDQGKNLIYLTPYSRLCIRLSAQNLPLIYPLAGKSLTIGKHKIRLGIPENNLLKPSPVLRSHLVVIKGYQEPDSFLAAAQRQLKELGIQGIARIPLRADGKLKQKNIKIKRYRVVGFSLEVDNLEPEDSLRLQQYGIGGKRKMGCGVFFPVRRRE